jgi:hypothetical protein
MPGAMVADEMGIGKTWTSVSAGMICKLLTEKVVMGLPQSILWGNTVEEWVMLADDDFPGIVGEQSEWYPHQRLNSVPPHLLQIPTTTPHGHPALILAHEAILVLTMHGVTETFNTVLYEMTHGIKYKPINLLHAKYANLTLKVPHPSIDKPENRRNIHIVLYDTLTSRAKPSSDGRHSHCSGSLGFLISLIDRRRNIV